MDAAGTITFEPAGDYHGPVRFAYEASDGTTRSTAEVVGTVTPVADAPVATDDAFTMAEDDGPRSCWTFSATTRTPTATSSRSPRSRAGKPLPGSKSRSRPTATRSRRATLRSARSAWTRRASITLRAPTQDYHGEVRFAYEATDGTTTVRRPRSSGTVTPVADAPVATDDAFTMAEDAGPLVLDLLGNDTDADGDQLAVATIEGQEAVAGLAKSR